jgi:cyclase
MNRRDFIVRSSCFTAAGLLLRSNLSAQAPAAPANRPATAPAPVTTEFKPLRRDVGIFNGRGGTIGWLSNRDALLAIDTQFPDTAKLFLAGLPGRGERTLDVVINTHHHGDHTGGNGVLKPATKSIVAHANVPGLQKARATQDKTLDNQTYADTTFAETWKKELGGEVVHARYHGAGHTKGDIITLLEKANVVHMGDLMFNRVYPVIDRPGGGNIGHWVTVLEEAAKTYPADAIYVFGHGNPKFGVTGTRGDLLLFRDYLSGLLDYVSKKIKVGESKEKIVGLDNLPGFADFHVPVGPANRLPGNLSVAFDELSEKKG